MQAVILAAGRGTRMGKLTETLPKPMLMVGGKNLLQHKIDILPPEVDEVIVVTGYLEQVIRDFFGSAYEGRKMTYVTQTNIVGGTADALWHAREFLHGKFLVLMGDDIYAQSDIVSCLEKEWALLVEHVRGTRAAGKVVTDEGGCIQAIEEGTHEGEWLAGTNMFVLDTRVFDQAPVPKAPGSQEMGLPQTVLEATKIHKIDLFAVPATHWIQITDPSDIQKAEAILKMTKKA